MSTTVPSSELPISTERASYPDYFSEPTLEATSVRHLAQLLAGLRPMTGGFDERRADR